MVLINRSSSSLSLHKINTKCLIQEILQIKYSLREGLTPLTIFMDQKNQKNLTIRIIYQVTLVASAKILMYS
jgi:hypothetical protein